MAERPMACSALSVTTGQEVAPSVPPATPILTAVNRQLTPGFVADATPTRATRRPQQRRRREVENPEYAAAMVNRLIERHGERVEDWDVEGAGDLLHLHDVVDEALDNAVAGLRGLVYSWSEIAGWVGITRQAAQQRWGR